MKNVSSIAKIYILHILIHKVAQERLMGKTIAFTNGCFGYFIATGISLSFTAAEADFLIVGLNSDTSTKRIKRSWPAR